MKKIGQYGLWNYMVLVRCSLHREQMIVGLFECCQVEFIC